MRVRMLIDVEAPEDSIPVLAEQICEQPPCLLQLNPGADVPMMYGGRFVGAQVVFEAE